VYAERTKLGVREFTFLRHGFASESFEASQLGMGLSQAIDLVHFSRGDLGTRGNPNSDFVNENQS